MRITVYDILGWLAAGMTNGENWNKFVAVLRREAKRFKSGSAPLIPPREPWLGNARGTDASGLPWLNLKLHVFQIASRTTVDKLNGYET